MSHLLLGFFNSLALLKSKSNLGVGSLDSWTLGLSLLSLENAASAKSVHISIGLIHESDRNVGQEVEDIDSSPGAFAIEVGRVRPRVGRGALQHDGSLGHAVVSFVVPVAESLDVSSLTLDETSISVELLAKQGADGLRKFVESRDDT